MTANRVGLLIQGDIRFAISALQKVDPSRYRWCGDGLGIRRESIVTNAEYLDLIEFMISDSYIELRRRLGSDEAAE